MPTRDGPRDHAAAVGRAARELGGALRRMVVSLTNDVLWQVTGHQLLDGTTEARDVEPFSGIGFYARPPASGGAPESIVAMVGGVESPAIIATRDEATRKASVGDAPADSAAVFNSRAIISVNPDGTVTACAVGGEPVALATLADLQAHRTAYNIHLHTATGALALTTVPTVLAPAPVGTSVLKGQ